VPDHCTKFNFGWGSRPHCGARSTPQTLYWLKLGGRKREKKEKMQMEGMGKVRERVRRCPHFLVENDANGLAPVAFR